MQAVFTLERLFAVFTAYFAEINRPIFHQHPVTLWLPTTHRTTSLALEI